VQWSHHSEDEATWEREDELKEEFPSCSLIFLNLGMRFFLRGRICNTLTITSLN
jgi:hypothetical protein